MYNDVYSKPEDHGLSIVGEAADDLSYEFDIFAVWKSVSDNQLYYASDSGCSCPSPFEAYYSKDDLTPATAQECLAALDEWDSEWGKSKDASSSLRSALMEL